VIKIINRAINAIKKINHLTALNNSERFYLLVTPTVTIIMDPDDRNDDQLLWSDETIYKRMNIIKEI